VRGATKAGHIVDFDRAVLLQARLDRADRCVDADMARLDGAAVSERGDEPDGAVPAHADIADIVEEDDAHLAVRTMRLAHERAYNGIRATRLVDNGAAIVVKVFAKAFDALRQRTFPKIGPAT
jgi:hypothetical protein